MNIYQIKSVNHVNMVILKQKKKLVFIVEVKNMEDLDVIIVVMKKMKMVKKQIILFVKIVSIMKMIYRR